MAYGENQEVVSRYNEASLNILRLHNCWQKIALYRQNYQFYKWKIELDSVWSEIYQDVMRKPNGDEYLNDQKLLLKQIQEACNYEVPVKDPFALNKLSKLEKIKKERLYIALSNYHLWLRKTQDDVGKGSSYRDASYDDFE